MKKKVSLLLISAILGSAMVGCSGGNADEDTTKTKPVAPASDAGLTHNIQNQAEKPSAD